MEILTCIDVAEKAMRNKNLDYALCLVAQNLSYVVTYMGLQIFLRQQLRTAFVKGCWLWYVHLHYLSMPIWHLPISKIRISDIGKSTDLPISENQNDLPISVIRIFDVGKLDDFLISVN